MYFDIELHAGAKMLIVQAIKCVNLFEFCSLLRSDETANFMLRVFYVILRDKTLPISCSVNDFCYKNTFYRCVVLSNLMTKRDRYCVS